MKGVDAVVHLAWSGLPNYKEFFHIDVNLCQDLCFLKEIVTVAKVKHLLVTGTCLEYGMQYGPLTEDMDTLPSTPYGFAKDVLRKSLEMLQVEHGFILQWLRLFYTYGEGQNPNSLLACLDTAINNGDDVFNMSRGDQLRDYLFVGDIAKDISLLMLNPEVSGVINCSSGLPISIRELVEQYLEIHGLSISLNRGYYGYPTYEPHAFWGEPEKLSKIRKHKLAKLFVDNK